MWKQYLSNENLITIYFNAWENDFHDDPIIIFIKEITDQLDNSQFNKSQKLNTAKKKLIVSGIKLLKLSLPIGVSLLTQGVVNAVTIKEIQDVLKSSKGDMDEVLTDQVKNAISNYEERKKELQHFKTSLLTFAEILIKETNINSPLVIFIDELDRCKPDYAIKLLEQIKHIFDINNIIFVLGIDYDQLSCSIKSFYGSEMDTIGYLSRFIDYRYKLPEPDISSYCYYLKDKFELSSIMKKPAEFDNAFDHIYINISIYNNSTLRELEHDFTEMSLIFSLLRNNFYIHPALVIFYLFIKSYDYDFYRKIRGREIDADNLIYYQKDNKRWNEQLLANSHYYAHVYAHTLLYLNEFDLLGTIKKIQGYINNINHEHQPKLYDFYMKMIAAVQSEEAQTSRFWSLDTLFQIFDITKGIMI